MKLLTITAAALVAVSAATQAAEPGKTREQVKAELREAIRTGDIAAPGDSGLRLNQLYPHRYPAADERSGRTRAEVRMELTSAIRTGDIQTGGEVSEKLNERYPGRYPPAAKGIGKSRDQVRAELAEAIRTGDIVEGESSLTRNQVHPNAYGPAVRRMAETGVGAGAATQ